MLSDLRKIMLLSGLVIYETLSSAIVNLIYSRYTLLHLIYY